MAAPALAASIAASAICCGVTGTLSERADGVAGAGDGAGDEDVAVHGKRHGFPPIAPLTEDMLLANACCAHLRIALDE